MAYDSLHPSQVDQQDPFSYPSQALEENQIRILEVQPGYGATGLKCSLEVSDRSLVRPYKALSYVWGTSSPDFCITINNKAFWIRENLKDALYRLRRSEQVLRLWTDAICINQLNDQERNVQVQKMGETYAHAEEVLVWLGNEGHVPETLREVGELSQNISDLSRDDIALKSSYVRELFRNPWFNRLWVYQEIALARKATMILGNEECDLLLLSNLCNDLIRVFDTLDPRLADHPAIAWNLVSLNGLILTHLTMNAELPPEEFSWDFRSTVRESVRRSCQDPRDHVYGLVGMAHHAGIEVQPVDYSLSVRAVYQNFMESSLIQNKNVLIDFSAGLSKLKNFELPSWVPDLSQGLMIDAFLIPGYAAGGLGREAGFSKSSFLPDESIFMLAGFQLDVIDTHHFCETSPGMIVEHINEHKTIFATHALKAESLWLNQPSSTNPYRDRDGQLDACWRTLVANVRKQIDTESGYLHAIDLADLDESRQYEMFVGRQPPPLVEDKEEFEHLLAFHNSFVASNRSLLLTRKGYFGVGPEESLAGDVIIVASGLAMPVILRKHAGNDRYQLVGPAYIHGVMKGEFVEQIPRTSERASKVYFIV